MKTCPKCKKEKDYSEFYKQTKSKDGYLTPCKQCRLEADRERRKNNPIWVLKRKMQNAKFHEDNREKIAERKKKWFASDKGKASHIKSSKKWKKENSSKVLAHQAIERAVKRGDIIPKKNCEICNSKFKIEAHHPDYRKRLEVIWLCKICHEKLT